MKDAADFEISEADGTFVIDVMPDTDGACPFVLELRQDQTFDLMIDDLQLTDQPITDLDLFVPFVEAIAAGHVVISELESAATGICLFRTCSVEAAGGVWTPAGKQPIAQALTNRGLGVVRRDRHFIAYRG